MAIVERMDEGGIATVTLRHPAKLNALSTGMIDALHAALDGIAGDAGIRVVILAAEGRAFCAGHDLAEMQAARAAPDGGQAAHQALFDQCTAMMQRIQSLPQPVIAQVQGLAVAAGCQLVATCDMAVASQEAKFGVNGVNIGLFCSTPMVALTRAIGRKAAFEMLTTGRLIDAAEARDLGLINRAVPAGTLADETRALALSVAAKLPTAIRYGKGAFYTQAEMPVAEAYAHTGAVIVANMSEPDTDEGISAFLEKRPPNWD